KRGVLAILVGSSATLGAIGYAVATNDHERQVERRAGHDDDHDDDDHDDDDHDDDDHDDDDHDDDHDDDDAEEGHAAGHGGHANAVYPVTTPLRTDTQLSRDYVCQIRAIRHIEVRALERGYLEE